MMKRTLFFFLGGALLNISWASDNASKQIQMLNSQIQAQLQEMQFTQQKQFQALNKQFQSQLQEVQKGLQTQIKTVNDQTQSQIKTLKEQLEQQIKQLYATQTEGSSKQEPAKQKENIPPKVPA